MSATLPAEAGCEQCCHSILTIFPYNKDEKSLDFPTPSDTKTQSSLATVQNI